MTKELKQEIKKMFTKFGKENEKDRMILYYEDLIETDINKTIKRIKQLRQTSKYLPTTGEILDMPILDENIKYEKAWDQFKKYYWKNEWEMPRGILEVMKHLGGIAHINSEFNLDAGKWLKKEFIKAYKLYKAGELSHLQKKEYIQIGKSFIEKESLSKGRTSTMLLKALEEPIEQKKLGY